jgi:hypothetical protein
MSSWGQSSTSLRSIPLGEHYVSVSTSGYGTNFKTVLKCYLYAKYHRKPLYLRDTTNNISKSFHLLFDTFTMPKNIIYTNKPGTSFNIDERTKLDTYISTLGATKIREGARNIFKLKDTMLQQMQPFLNTVQNIRFDLGVQIRTGDKIQTGEMEYISLDAYIDAMKKYCESKTIIEPNIFIMTDNADIFPKIIQIVPSTWHLYRIECEVVPSGGHDQSTFNAQPIEYKKSAYIHFLSELYILQHVPHIICTYSSNIGRYLFMTAEDNTTVESLDWPEFTVP